MVAPVAITARIPTLASSQNPDRVSKDLRSSTAAIRRIGIGAGSRRTTSRVSVSAVTARVVMLLLLLVGSRR